MGRPPIVASALYKTVTDRSHGHCQCKHGEPGACGRDTHPVTGRSCYTRADVDAPLHVVPVDPTTPLHVAVGLSADDLMVLCRTCFTRRTNATKKAREQAAAEAAAAEPLF